MRHVHHPGDLSRLSHSRMPLSTAADIGEYTCITGSKTVYFQQVIHHEHEQMLVMHNNANLSTKY